MRDERKNHERKSDPGKSNEKLVKRRETRKIRGCKNPGEGFFKKRPGEGTLSRDPQK